MTSGVEVEPGKKGASPERRRGSGWDLCYWLVVGAVCAVLFGPALLHPLILFGSPDVFSHMWPINLVAAQAIRGGEWPQWNPAIFCGTPLIISGNNSYYYPPTLLASVLEPELMLRLLTWLIPVHMVAAAAAARACLGAFIRSRFWAVYAALAYWLSFPLFFELLGSPAGNGYLAYVILPWWLYAARTEARRSTAENLLLQGVMLGYLLLGGFLQYVLYVLALGLLIGILDAAAGPGMWVAIVRRSGVMLAAIVIALLLAGIRLAPWAATMMHTGQGTAMTFAEAHARYAIPVSYLGRYGAPYWMYMDEPALCIVFMGTLTAALTLASLGSGLPARRNLPWLISAAVIILIMLGTPLAALSHWLMGGQAVPFWRITMFLVLPLAILAGRAGQRSESPRHGPALRRRVLVVLAAILLVQVLVWAGFSGEEKKTSATTMLLSTGWMLLAVVVYARFRTVPVSGMRYRLTLLLFLVVELLVSGLVIFAHTHQRVLAPIPAADYSREPSVAPRDGRILPVAGRWWGNMPVFAGWYSSGGYDSISPVVIAELYRGGESVEREDRRWVMPRSLRVRQLTSTQWWRESDREGWQRVPDPLPRVRMVFEWETAASRAAAVRRVLADEFPLQSRVVIEAADEFPPAFRNAIDPSATAVITQETPNSVTIVTTAEADGLLVLADTDYDGWEAGVDGRPTAMVRVNGAFRGVPVAAGTHTVRFRYRQPGLIPGSVMSAGGLSALLLLLVLAVRRRWFGTPPAGVANDESTVH